MMANLNIAQQYSNMNFSALQRKQIPAFSLKIDSKSYSKQAKQNYLNDHYSFQVVLTFLCQNFQ